MAQQGGSGNNYKTPTKSPVGGRTTTTPPRVPGAETPPSPRTPVTPPPEPSTALTIGGPSSGSKRPLSPNITKSSCICPVCGKEMYHEKALNGHIRWHTQKQRDAAAAGIRVARSLASSVVVLEGNEEEDQGSASKRQKLPDLNSSPPSDDQREE